MQEHVGSLCAIWIDLICVVPYVLTRLIVIVFPFMIIFSHIVPKIIKENNDIQWYYKNEIINNTENMFKHLLLIVNLFFIR